MAATSITGSQTLSGIGALAMFVCAKVEYFPLLMINVIISSSSTVVDVVVYYRVRLV